MPTVSPKPSMQLEQAQEQEEKESIHLQKIVFLSPQFMSVCLFLLLFNLFFRYFVLYGGVSDFNI